MVVWERNAAKKKEKIIKWNQCIYIRKVQNKLQGNPPNGTTCLEIPFPEAISITLNQNLPREVGCKTTIFSWGKNIFLTLRNINYKVVLLFFIYVFIISPQCYQQLSSHFTHESQQILWQTALFNIPYNHTVLMADTIITSSDFLRQYITFCLFFL